MLILINLFMMDDPERIRRVGATCVAVQPRKSSTAGTSRTSRGEEEAKKITLRVGPLPSKKDGKKMPLPMAHRVYGTCSFCGNLCHVRR